MVQFSNEDLINILIFIILLVVLFMSIYCISKNIIKESFRGEGGGHGGGGHGGHGGRGFGGRGYGDGGYGGNYYLNRGLATGAVLGSLGVADSLFYDNGSNYYSDPIYVTQPVIIDQVPFSRDIYNEE